MTTPLTDGFGAKSFHIRNPIRRHGDNPSGDFVMILNELARDTALSHHAYRIAIVMRTHIEGFEVSAAGFAGAYSWGRSRVQAALDELVEARWLVVRRYLNAAGKRVFDEYHVRSDRRFTDEEFAALSQPVNLQAAGPCEGIPVTPGESGGCSRTEHPPASQQVTKENHLEDQIEDQIENYAADRAGVESTSTCWQCKTVGPEACLLHTSSPIGQRQLSGMSV